MHTILLVKISNPHPVTSVQENFFQTEHHLKMSESVAGSDLVTNPVGGSNEENNEEGGTVLYVSNLTRYKLHLHQY